MAALPESPETQVVDLRKLSVQDLAPVLAEEMLTWRDALNWDLQPSVELIERFVGMQALNGCALLRGGRAIGYAYFVREDHKALIGDLYVLRRQQSPDCVLAMLESALDAMWRSPGVHRVETQLLMLNDPARFSKGRMPFAQWFQSYPRIFFEIATAKVEHLSPCSFKQRISIVPWREEQQEASAWLVSESYRAHIDSEINDQYRSPSGARRFLTNIVQYPGCGTFFAPASFAAFDRSGNMCGMSLASLVAPQTGHITQICVAPSHKGIGLGYEMLRQSLLALSSHGCTTVGLTVTTANHEAVRLYQKMGFLVKREFAAWVWDAR